jgi:hypothetical protein
LAGKPEVKIQIARPGHTWEYNIKMDFKEIGYEVVWIYLAQGRDSRRDILKMVMNIQIRF